MSVGRSGAGVRGAPTRGPVRVCVGRRAAPTPVPCRPDSHRAAVPPRGSDLVAPERRAHTARVLVCGANTTRLCVEPTPEIMCGANTTRLCVEPTPRDSTCSFVYGANVLPPWLSDYGVQRGPAQHCDHASVHILARHGAFTRVPLLR